MSIVVIRSARFPGIYLRLDGKGVPRRSGTAGGGVVNCQYGADSYESFNLIDNSDGTISFGSTIFNNVFLRMDGSRVTDQDKDGAGQVNAQYGVGAFEKFRLVTKDDGSQSIESAAFPGVFLRMDGSGLTKYMETGGGVVNCRLGARTYENFHILRPDWLDIGRDFDTVLTGTGKIYGVRSNGEIERYIGDENNWISCGRDYKSLVCNKNTLYGIPVTGVGVFMHVEGRSWSQIYSDDVAQLVAHGRTLFILTKDGVIKTLLPDRDQWVAYPRVSQRIKSFTAKENHVFILTETDEIYYFVRYTGWDLVGRGFSTIVMSDNNLFGIDNSGSLLRWERKSGEWSNLGPLGRDVTLLAGGTDLLYITKDNTGIWRYIAENSQWRKISGPARSVSLDNNLIVAVRPGRIASLYVPHQQKGRQHPPPREEEGTEWLWSFQTADETFAGFTGKVRTTLFSARSQWGTFQIPYEDFARGALYSFPITLSDEDCAAIMLQGERTLFDHWTVTTVMAWNERSKYLYRFDYNRDVPTDTPNPSIPYTTKILWRGRPDGVKIHTWPFISGGIASGTLIEAFGHASMTLSDGTHISWWPLGVNREPMTSIKFLGDLYTADPVPNMTYDRDVRFEGVAPDTVILGGLAEERIKAWWSEYSANPDNKWNSLHSNCSTIIYRALIAGGVRDLLAVEDRGRFLDKQPFWTPTAILNVVMRARMRQIGPP